ncbi:hypothetical protein [uncultured Brachyspira sp.]|uniref:hypothetical protein n=1 Tax=uncultured Brachyspira sp. TaxID=221953 RepID=UPI00263822F8|nr:hypothetical protein [uncultured Brachyspira sp.]
MRRRKLKSNKPHTYSTSFSRLQLAFDNFEHYRAGSRYGEYQERIVKILDRFEALCNDIISGLPAEIELRKKQYEYYRDKLLTFKEKKIKE